MVTLSVAICTFGFLLPSRFFRDRIASFGCTVLERIMSEISRFNARSSLWRERVSATSVCQDAFFLHLQAGRGCALDVLIQRRDAREPSRHVDRRVPVVGDHK